MSKDYSDFLMDVMQPVSLSDQEIVEIIMFPLVNEACRVLDGVASIHGISFPSYPVIMLDSFSV